MEQMTEFPSPIGESYFSIGMAKEWRGRLGVSVPYRGILFFNSLRASKN